MPKPPHDPTLDLTRTHLALADYDAAYARLDHLDGMTNDDIDKAVQDVDDLAKDVGYAFAQDTRDRNAPEDACRVRPGPWLRALLEEYPAR